MLPSPEPLMPPSPARSLSGRIEAFARVSALTSRARIGVAASLGARALEAAAKFGLYALTARMLGPADAGRFFLALGVIHIVSTVARLGLERPIVRHVAAELAIGDTRAAGRAALQGCGAVLAASLFAAAALALAAPIMADRLAGQAGMGPVLMLAALVVPVQNLAYALAYVLIGLERGAAGQMVMNALAPTLTLAALILGADDLPGLMRAYAGAFGLCVLIGLVLVVMQARSWRRDQALDAHRELPSLWRGARPMWLVEISQAALLSLPVLALGVFAAPAAVSVFSICSRLSMLVTTVVLSLGALSAPLFARHHRLGDWAALGAAVRANRRATILLCVPLTIGMAIGAGPLLGLLGVSAEAGTPVLMILLAGQMVFCLLPSRDLVLAMAGEGGTLRRLSLRQLGACAILCLVLIPPFAAVGAALASAAIWIGGAVALALAVRRRLPELRL